MTGKREPEARKSQRRKKRRGFFRRGSLLFFLGVLGVIAFLFGPQYWHWRQMQTEIARLQQVKDQLGQQQAQLQEEIQLLQTDAYIEGIARKELGLVKPGETAVMWGKPGDVRPLKKGSTYDEAIKD